MPGVAFGSASNLTGLTIRGSTGDDDWDIEGTSASLPTAIDTAPASGMSDTVTIGGESHHTISLLGSLDVYGGGAGTTSLAVDDASGTHSRSVMLSYDTVSSVSDLTGIAPATIGYGPGIAHVNLIPSDQTGVTTTLTVDFSQGNPLPVGAGTSFDFGGMLGDSNSLILQGGSTPFDSETYSPMAHAPGAARSRSRSARRR